MSSVLVSILCSVQYYCMHMQGTRKAVSGGYVLMRTQRKVGDRTM